MHFFKKNTPIVALGVFYIFLNFVLRIAILVHPITQLSLKWYDVVKLFVIGTFSDTLVFVISSAILWLYLLFLSNGKYQKPWGYLLFGLLLLLLLYVSFCNTLLNEYGGAVPTIGVSFIALKTLFFGMLLFMKRWRSTIRLILYSITVFLVVLILLLNSISEWFFWNEFGVRYNFIAVDYLMYTHTVIRNIIESYPMIPLCSFIGFVSIISTYYLVKYTLPFLEKLPTLTNKIKSLVMYLILFVISLQLLPILNSYSLSSNVFANELQANGAYRFYEAFMTSELNYNQFYTKIPNDEAFAIMKQQIAGIRKQTTVHTITADSTEIKKNVVLITIESLSAEFMKAYGNTQGLTPFLDKLATQSLQFSNLYSTGNRTVRGLEAVTMCIPPTPGESVVKRKDNKNKFTTGSVFKHKGYQIKYLYGGDAYFDNMDSFFRGNHYEIVDKKSFQPKEITFSNIWGVCDEDMAKKAIEIMNLEAQSTKPFFNHWMTVSNHRPFTYPEGKIDIDSHSKSREGGVKYTDYALQKFFALAEKQAWFKNTVFVIVADHCASSAGKTDLPLDRYRIPGMIYSPGFIKPGICTTLMSQIDIMPTLFGLLHFDYESKFYGQDIMKSDYKPRALIATYQDLGLIKEDVLTILSPRQKIKQYQLIAPKKSGIPMEFQLYYEQKPIIKERKDLIKATISYYQTASYLLQKDKLNQ